MTDAGRLLRHLVEQEAVIGAGLPGNSCIAQVRIALQVCRYFGVAARAVPVSVRGFLHGTYLDSLCATDEVEPLGWRGHLILQVDRWLIDLTADQFAPRGSRDRVAAAVRRVPPGWPATVARFELSTGLTLEYEAAPRAQGFLKAPQWQLTAARREVVAQLIRGYAATTPSFLAARASCTCSRTDAASGVNPKLCLYGGHERVRGGVGPPGDRLCALRSW